MFPRICFRSFQITFKKRFPYVLAFEIFVEKFFFYVRIHFVWEMAEKKSICCLAFITQFLSLPFQSIVWCLMLYRRHSLWVWWVVHIACVEKDFLSDVYVYISMFSVSMFSMSMFSASMFSVSMFSESMFSV